MALSRLDQLYRQVILDHSGHPRNHGHLGEDSQKVELHNPTCGDVITLEVKLTDGKIEQVAFSGHGCSISTASASMMTEVIIGKTLEEASELSEIFSGLVQGKSVDADRLKDGAILSGVAKFPARIKCATLGWKALDQIIAHPEIQNYQENIED
ncbi:Fe-S cluster assembly sulfur transfer protein SufU [Enterococcus sp. LJL98]